MNLHHFFFLTYMHSHTHSFSAGEFSATFSVGLMWQKNGAKALAPQSEHQCNLPHDERRAGWLASSWMGIKVNAAL